MIYVRVHVLIDKRMEKSVLEMRHKREERILGERFNLKKSEKGKKVYLAIARMIDDS